MQAVVVDAGTRVACARRNSCQVVALEARHACRRRGRSASEAVATAEQARPSEQVVSGKASKTKNGRRTGGAPFTTKLAGIIKEVEL